MSDLESIGIELRIAREHRRLSLRQVEQKIHIRAKFLEALETGQLDQLPAPVQTRGFLRNYARYLGLDAETLVTRWDEVIAGGSRKRRLGRTGEYAPVTGKTNVTGPTASRASGLYPTVIEPPRRRWLWVVLTLMLVLIIAGGVLALSIAANRPNLTEGILATVPVLPTLEATPTTGFTPIPPTPTIDPSAPPSKGQEVFTDVSIQLEVKARTWLQVTVDGVVSYQGAPAPNTILQYRGTQVRVRASNAFGVRAVVNGTDLGVLGVRGQIFDQTFTPNAALDQTTPTPIEITPPGTPTLAPEARG